MLIRQEAINLAAHEGYRQLGLRTDGNTPADASIAPTEIGAARWYSDHRIIGIPSQATSGNAHFGAETRVDIATDGINGN